MKNTYWKTFLQEESVKDYFIKLKKTLNDMHINGKIIYPEKEDWLNFSLISPEETKIIILGQDPYHGENQAHGFSFSVKKDVKIPPSLKNIYKEIEQEFFIKMSSKNGNLMPWVDQGVMLLNSILTVEKSNPGSHKNIGWEIFTDTIIKKISSEFEQKIFMLWGAYAIKKASLIDQSKHLVLTSPHPSPFSAYTGFFGNNHFKMANDFLIKNNKKPIDWSIVD